MAFIRMYNHKNMKKREYYISQQAKKRQIHDFFSYADIVVASHHVPRTSEQQRTKCDDKLLLCIASESSYGQIPIFMPHIYTRIKALCFVEKSHEKHANIVSFPI